MPMLFLWESDFGKPCTTAVSDKTDDFLSLYYTIQYADVSEDTINIK